MSQPENPHVQYLEMAVQLGLRGASSGNNGPFGAVVVKNGEVLATGYNQVTETNDPTAHAEVVAIRNASQKLGSFQLDGCILYASCEPCPMCLGAIYWARPSRVYFAATRHDAAAAGFDDAFIYQELQIDSSKRQISMEYIKLESAVQLFKSWLENPDRRTY